MKKIKVEVTRVDTYVIEVDETIYNKEWHDDFKQYFHDVTSHMDLSTDVDEDESSAIAEGIAISLSTHQARFHSEYDFIEGFGYVNRNGKLPFSPVDFDKKGVKLPESERRQPSEGLNIIIESQDNDIECETTFIDEPET